MVKKAVLMRYTNKLYHITLYLKLYYTVYMFKRLLQWLFPSYCIGCGSVGSDLCDDCLSKAPKSAPPEDLWVTSLFAYSNDTIHKAIWAIKYKGRYPLALRFGSYLSDATLVLLEDTLTFNDAEEITIVPIPASSSGKRKRGYNQSELLARALIEKLDIKATLMPKALKKIRNTPRQSEIKKRSERIENIAGAFMAQGNVNGKTILLVDDVTTTGATLREARRALRAAGAKHIYAVTVAH